MNMMIRAHNIVKRYDALTVLRGVSLEIAPREIVSIIGPSGAGKTTLLQIIGTLDKPTEGSFTIDGVNPLELNEKMLARFRNTKLGFVFQFHQLLPEFTAIENVMMPALIGGVNKNDAIKEAERLLDYLGLRERGHHKPNELSGGEKQRVAVARALINKPSVLLADEPSGSLDSKNREELHNLFLDLRDNFGQTILIVTHDASLASLSDRVLKMRDGVIED